MGNPTLAEIEAQTEAGLRGEGAPQSDSPPSLQSIEQTVEGGLKEGVPKPDSTPPANSSWGPALNFLNGLLLGGGKSLMASPTMDEAAKGDFSGYRKRKGELDTAQAAYEKEHPNQALATELAGSTLTTLPAMALGQEYLAGPLAAKLVSGGGKLAKGFSSLLGGATQGGIAGGATSGLNDRSLVDNVLTGAGVGAIANPLLGAAAAPLTAAVAPTVRSMASKFNELVPLRTSQIPGAPAVTKMFDKAVSPEQYDAVTEQVLKSMGHKGDVLNQDSLDTAKDALSKRFNFIARGTSLKDASGNLNTALTDLSSKLNGPYSPSVNEPTMESFKKILNGIQQELMTSGRISGDTYQALTQTGSALQNALKKSSPARPYAIDLKNALDDALGESQPKLKKALDLTRHQWNNSILAEDVMNETTGKVEPKDLLRQVEKRYGTSGKADQRAESVGSSVPIGTLAEGGKNFLGARPSSFVGNVAHNAGWPLAAGAVAAELGGPLTEHLFSSIPSAGAVVGTAAAGTALGGGAGRLMNMPWYRNMLLKGNPELPANPLLSPLAQGYNETPR